MLYEEMSRWKKYLEETFYVGGYMLEYYIYLKDMEGIKKHLESYLNDPVETIDYFIPLFDKMIYYGFRDLTKDISIKIHDEVRDSDLLFARERGSVFKCYIYGNRAGNLQRPEERKSR